MNTTQHDAIIAFCEQEFGPVHPLALAEIVPDDVPITVHCCPAANEDGVTTLFTTGLSAHAMNHHREFGGHEYRVCVCV